MIEIEAKKILDDLSKISKISKSEMFQDCIIKRLETSLENYCKDLTLQYDYLYNKQELNVLKNL